MVANQSVAMLLLDFASVDLENPSPSRTRRPSSSTRPAPTTLLPSVLENAALGIFDSVEAKKHATPDDPWAREWLKTNTASFGPYTVGEVRSRQRGHAQGPLGLLVRQPEDPDRDDAQRPGRGRAGRNCCSLGPPT